MTWHSHSVVLDLWCAQAILQAGVAVNLWRRKLHKQFPVFFLCLLAQVANFAIILPFWLTGGYKMYFALYWLGEAVNAFLSFKAIHEIFLDVFRPYHTLKDLGTVLFRWAGLVMLLVSIVVAFSNGADQSPVFHALTTLQTSVHVVQLGLILFLLLFSRFLGVSRRQVSFGISLGFGVIAGADLLLMALNAGGFVGIKELNLINMTAYVVAIMVWLAYSFSRAGARTLATNRLQTDRWEQGLADIQHPIPSDSLIPMFENMVERAFTRSSVMDIVDDSLNKPRAHTAAAGSSTGSNGSKDRP